jgi:hypothetical protein
MQRCKGLTTKGAPCKRRSPTGYCPQHTRDMSRMVVCIIPFVIKHLTPRALVSLVGTCQTLRSLNQLWDALYLIMFEWDLGARPSMQDYITAVNKLHPMQQRLAHKIIFQPCADYIRLCLTMLPHEDPTRHDEIIADWIDDKPKMALVERLARIKKLDQ